jgi:two-component system, LytTR family, response regulator
MRIAIIEDEELAVEKLEILLSKMNFPTTVVAKLDSVRAAIAWFSTNPAPDLAFFDIQLADGVSFDIFEQTPVTCPVIFTTAYDEYALRAFKVNSIDYLLKPFGTEDLKKAFEKLHNLQAKSTTPSVAIDADIIRQVAAALKAPPQYRNRFMVKIGEHLSAIAVEDIEFFYGENKIVYLKNKNGRKYVVDYTLEQLETMLDPLRFFRLNRKFISTIEAIKDVISYSNSRLKIVLIAPPDKEDVLVSREKVESFKEWFGK